LLSGSPPRRWSAQHTQDAADHHACTSEQGDGDRDLPLVADGRREEVRSLLSALGHGDVTVAVLRAIEGHVRRGDDGGPALDHAGAPSPARLEFGVLIDNPNLAESAERELRQAEDIVFERVQITSATGRGG
jgi:hypothetical protein